MELGECEAIQVQRVESGDQLAVTLSALNAETQFEVANVIPGNKHGASVFATARELDSDMFVRGVRSRSIFDASVRRDRATEEYVRWLNEHNSEVRTLQIVPLRIIISDRATAILPTDIACPQKGITVYREPSAVNAFVFLFDTLWAQASVWGERFSDHGREISDRDKTILELLAIGERYDSVAQRLSLNERTVRRSYESVAKELNAATPFEAAYKAVKRGWL